MVKAGWIWPAEGSKVPDRPPYRIKRKTTHHTPLRREFQTRFPPEHGGGHKQRKWCLWKKHFVEKVAYAVVCVFFTFNSSFMSSYLVLDTTGTTYTIYEIEKRKETIKEKTKIK